jgi:hypothetical protein
MTPEEPREPVVPTGTPNRPKTLLFGPRKGAEVPDLNALKLCETRGFSGKSHIKSMFPVQFCPSVYWQISILCIANLRPEIKIIAISIMPEVV